jgi:hypothetical protein
MGDETVLHAIAGNVRQEFFQGVHVVKGLGQGESAAAPGAVKEYLASAAADNEPRTAFLASSLARGVAVSVSKRGVEHSVAL